MLPCCTIQHTCCRHSAYIQHTYMLPCCTYKACIQHTCCIYTCCLAAHIRHIYSIHDAHIRHLFSCGCIHKIEMHHMYATYKHTRCAEYMHAEYVQLFMCSTHCAHFAEMCADLICLCVAHVWRCFNYSACSTHAK